MLIFTRRNQETVMIGDNINITILGIKGNHVRLGINAPASTKVHRKEVYLRIKDEKGGLYNNHQTLQDYKRQSTN
jgi:carbon storage regulator